jgi:hypothetical protein
MLQTQTVERDTLGLLKDLLTMPELKDFALVGGTNLALRLGHRLSVDLDLFTNTTFDTEGVARALTARFPNTQIASRSHNMLFAYINDVKVDMVLLPYPYIEPVEDFDGIRLVSLPDIMAMKMSAIAHRGVKKDFWDVAELLDMYSLSEMIEFYKIKYTSHDIFHLVRSLTYFADAEKQKEDPESLKKITWKQVKTKMEKATANYLKRNKI